MKRNWCLFAVWTLLKWTLKAHFPYRSKRSCHKLEIRTIGCCQRQGQTKPNPTKPTQVPDRLTKRIGIVYQYCTRTNWMKSNLTKKHQCKATLRGNRVNDILLSHLFFSPYLLETIFFSSHFVNKNIHNKTHLQSACTVTHHWYSMQICSPSKDHFTEVEDETTFL